MVRELAPLYGAAHYLRPCERLFCSVDADSAYRRSAVGPRFRLLACTATNQGRASRLGDARHIHKNPPVRPGPVAESVSTVLTPSKFRQLVSGERPGITAWILRGVLRLAEYPYSWATAWRNHRFDREAAQIIRVPAAVVSVGNLTVGGTGKTPMVEWLGRFLAEHELRVAILSRGYGAAAGEKNDEALELELSLPDTPHLQSANRSAIAQQAVEEYHSNLLLLDDGFQHRRLGRDFDIVLLDASAPFGFGHQLPRGMLRESPSGLQRADAVVLSRADLLPAPQRAALKQRVAELAPNAIWSEVIHQPAALVAADGRRTSTDQLNGKRVAAFCGIGNPAGFRHTLDAFGVHVAAWREFSDHFRYETHDKQKLIEWAEQSEVELAVCTRKDLVKLPVKSLGRVPLWALAVEVRFLCGQAELEAAVLRVANKSLAPLAG